MYNKSTRLGDLLHHLTHPLFGPYPGPSLDLRVILVVPEEASARVVELLDRIR